MSFTSTLRHADPDTARRYPLPVLGEAPWQSGNGAWHLEFTLPELSTGTILLPSLAFTPATATTGSPAPEAVQRHQWTLSADAGEWPLQQVPALPGVPHARTGTDVSSHIDCYHIHRTLANPVLHLKIEAPEAPDRYLVCISARTLVVADPPLPSRHVALARPPTPRSQMTAPQAIATRICSPTCVSMVLTLWNRPHDWLVLAEECHDPASGMYGVWPLAVAAAARRDCIGAVEVFEDWEAPLTVLAAGVPLVTSIRFFAGELPGAPLGETHGHLVVVHGAGPQSVLVCDPAAPEGEVSREYPADAFSRAWLRHRGAAYILPS